MSVSTNPSKRFSPVRVTPSAITRVASANVLPSKNSAANRSRDRSRSWNSLSFAALASTNARDTDELDKPNAPGIASAAAT